MKKQLLASILSIAIAGVAGAHTHLKTSVPADGSTVATAPAEFQLTFGEAAKLTALTVQKDGAKEQKIEGLPTSAAAQFKVAAPPLDSGHYTLSYRVLGDDGHVMSGKIGFTVGAAR